MKPLDLSMPVCTLDGRRARILCTDREYTDGSMARRHERTSYCVVALIERYYGKIGVESVQLYTPDGETACGHEPGSENWNDKLVNLDSVGDLFPVERTLT